jgi:hypothetical protein
MPVWQEVGVTSSIHALLAKQVRKVEDPSRISNPDIASITSRIAKLGISPNTVQEPYRPIAVVPSLGGEYLKIVGKI